jgi:hypothetical protein
MIQPVRRIVVSLAMLVAITLGVPVTAQSLETSPVAAPTGMLAMADCDQLPSEAEIWFLRFQFEPGGTLQDDQQIGPSLLAVETGTLTLVSDRAVVVTRAATPTAGSPSTPDTETVLAEGDSALVADGTTISALNDSAEPATVLALLVFSPEREVIASQEGADESEPVGVTTQAISVGRGEFPEGPGTLSIERLAVAPRAAVPLGVSDGAEVGAVEQGNLRIALTSGDGWIWPGIMAASTGPDATAPERVMLAAGTSTPLASSDGYALSGAISTGQAEGDEPAIVLRARVVPEAAAAPT